LINNIKNITKMGLSTTDLPKGGGLPKTIQPGNYSLKINSVYLDDFKFIEGAKHLIMNVETEEIEGFEGFLVDKADPSLGHFKGQIGRVKASQYAFADGKTKSGIVIYRDRSTLIFLSNLCKALGQSEWFATQDNKHDTIDEFVNAFNEEAPFKDVFMDFCIAGKEYESNSGYTNYDLWLPKSSKKGYAYVEKDSDRLLEYNAVDHLKKIEATKVSGFGDSNDTDVSAKAASDFSLD
jgi:hypothetical protein